MSQRDEFEQWLNQGHCNGANESMRKAWNAALESTLRALAPIAARQTNLDASAAVSDCIEAVQKLRGE